MRLIDNHRLDISLHVNATRPHPLCISVSEGLGLLAFRIVGSWAREEVVRLAQIYPLARVEVSAGIPQARTDFPHIIISQIA